MKTQTSRVMIFVYIYDLVILDYTQLVATWAKTKLVSLFKMKDHGELRYYLGVTSEQKRTVISLHQAVYCKPVLERFGVDSAKPTPTVEDANDLFLEGSANAAAHMCTGKPPYKELEECLIHISTHTRTDTTF